MRHPVQSREHHRSKCASLMVLVHPKQASHTSMNASHASVGIGCHKDHVPQDLSCTYLAHHELESVLIIVIIKRHGQCMTLVYRASLAT